MPVAKIKARIPPSLKKASIKIMLKPKERAIIQQKVKSPLFGKENDISAFLRFLPPFYKNLSDGAPDKNG